MTGQHYFMFFILGGVIVSIGIPTGLMMLADLITFLKKSKGNIFKPIIELYCEALRELKAAIRK